MKPPVGPANTPSPPCIPAKTGSPKVPMAINTAVLTRHCFVGRIMAESIMPKSARLIGTGAIGMVIMEQMQIMAEKRAHLHIVLIRLFIL